MQLKFKHTYILAMLLLVSISCRQTKYVPDGRYLLDKNKIVQDKTSPFEKEDLEEIIRQKPNKKSLFIKWKLAAYNSIDTAKVAAKRDRKNLKLREKNQKRRNKAAAVNERRIERAREKNAELYTKKIPKLKDTINPNLFFREWLMRKMGQPPVIFDSILFDKSLEQLQAFMRTKGYYNANVSGAVRYKKNRKAIVTYAVQPGEAFVIDSFFIKSASPRMLTEYKNYLKKNDINFVEEVFDAEMLDDHRSAVSLYMRNKSYYGFSPSHIRFEADTVRPSELKVSIGIIIQDRLVHHPDVADSMIVKPHTPTKIRNVYFHISDSLEYSGIYRQLLDSAQLTMDGLQFLPSLDTLVYKGMARGGNEFDPLREAVFYYNGRPFVKPELLEYQNYLEKTNPYKAYYVERTYESLLRLGLFESIKVELIEDIQGNAIDVHYYLAPLKKQSFGFQPHATHSKGFLGAAVSLNYTNRNLMRGGQKLTISMMGGFESQPPVLDEDADRTFNTFEVGPSVKLEIPRFFPLKITALAKRHKPTTTISAAYNQQHRDAFDRHTFQLNYLWNFFNTDKTQIFHLGLPGASVIKFVDIEKSPEFIQTLTELNDLFLDNAYSDQFIWEDLQLQFEYSNREKKDRKGDIQLYYSATMNAAGSILSAFGSFQDTVENGQRSIFGVGYSQFIRLDNELIITDRVGDEQSLNYAIKVGGGRPFGNSTSAMPYDYSFFGGGANDNRGWRARSLGPGAYEYFVDTNRAATQIGDFRLAASMEYRFLITSFVKGGLFLDAGNMWLINKDENRKYGELTPEWYNQLAIAGGVGLRLDFEYFILRFDVGFPLRNPSYPKASRWVFQSRKAYIDRGIEIFGDDEDEFGVKEYEKYLPSSPFRPRLHVGLGYPF